MASRGTCRGNGKPRQVPWRCGGLLALTIAAHRSATGRIMSTPTATPTASHGKAHGKPRGELHGNPRQPTTSPVAIPAASPAVTPTARPMARLTASPMVSLASSSTAIYVASPAESPTASPTASHGKPLALNDNSSLREQETMFNICGRKNSQTLLTDNVTVTTGRR